MISSVASWLGRLRDRKFVSCAVLLWVSFIATTTSGATTEVRCPMVCSRGPSGQRFEAVVTMPTVAQRGSILAVRIDAKSSGKISNSGLNYIHDMSTDYLIPSGASYVAGSAQIVPETGTKNVRPHARVWHDAGKVHLVLPGRVENESHYTAPSIAFELKVGAAPGSLLALKFEHYEVVANVFLLGELRSRCDPQPKPYTLAVTRVVDE